MTTVASQVIQARADAIAPSVLSSLRGLTAFLARPWVGLIVRLAIYLLLGGLPGWIGALLAALLEAWGPLLKDDVRDDLIAFKAVLDTYRHDAPAELMGKLPPREWGATPFKDPARAAKMARATAATLAKGAE